MAARMVEQNALTNFLYANKFIAPLWLVLRLYLGYQWFMAGWEKFHDAAWVGDQRGAALTGFIQGALHKTAAYCTNPASCHPDVQGWYASFLQGFVLPHVVPWSYLVTAGEMLVGIGLIVGFLVGVTAFFGMFMNLNFMLAGSVSVNPIWFTLGVFLVLAWRVAGYWGLDYYALPLLNRMKEVNEGGYEGG